ncbi:ATP-binding protein [Mesorhizobium sp. BR1-1-12]|uniref:AAA family ATPase n=1 Tax=unclassified Mesorhizobium TaxID=325217 RepID=UPI0015E2EF18|nr:MULTISPECIES: AAA family ATPase [unclassified Mesorhizobium]MBZ9919090.1 ATP-binding protein [Mesorhizobium sp. BR1-1-7]MBZ9970131.1 ATP-binding protein [Mesorhizobium sp. BR1-1-12]
MLRRLRIQRFKSIFEQEIDFGKVNLFVGPNGAGKSNVLEALGILAAALSNGLDPSVLDVKGVRLSLPHQFKSAFKNEHLPSTFRLEAEFDNGRYDCSISAGTNRSFLEFGTEALYDGDQQVFGRSGHGIKLHSARDQIPSFEKSAVASARSVWSVVGPFAKISAGLRAELEEFSRFAIYAPQTAIMRGMAVDNRIVEPLGLTGSGLATALDTVLTENMPREKIDSFLKIIWEPGWANQIEISNLDTSIVPAHVLSEGRVMYIRDRYMRAGRNKLSAFDASEGTLYLIFVATLLAHKQTPKAFGLDNVDGTLNPRLVRSLSKHLVDIVTGSSPEENRQAFMTSHHPSSLDSVDIFDQDQKIFVVSRDDDPKRRGQSNYFSLRPPGGMTKAKWVEAHGGKNLSELLLSERIPGAL